MIKKVYIEGQEVGYNLCIFMEELEPKFHGKGKGRRFAKFKCRCGKIFECVIESVTSGKTRSCGCLNDLIRQKTLKNRKTHGMSKTNFYRRWSAIKRRCYKEDSQDYPLYGGRGIQVCDRWKNSFENFYEDMWDTYRPGLEIDRIDVNGHYKPENCRWVTEQVQAWNQRVYKNNSSGKSGVTRTKNKKKWEVRISKDCVEHYLGCFNTLEEAISKREEMEIKFYGCIK